MRRLVPIAAAHGVGNALLLWLGYYWLGLGETRAATLAWSALVALVLLCGSCWLYGATFAYFAPDRPRLRTALRTSVRRLAPLAAAAIAVLAVYLALAWLAAASGQPAFRIASYLTKLFRRPVKPSAVQGVFAVVLWLVRWMAAPVAALPVFAGIATRGRRAAGTRSRTRLYWIATPVLLVCALWLPLKLAGWTPHVGGFWMQMGSFAVRLAIAYLLFEGAWLTLAFLTSGGSPRDTQSSTAVSP